MTTISFLDAISQALREEMQRDERVFLLGEDIGAFGGAFKVTRGFLEEFGQWRVMDMPIAESGFVGMGCAAAIEGQIPVVEFQFADFIACAFDQIINFAAKVHYRWGMPCPIVFRAPCGGGVRGGPYHSESPEAWFTNVPGLKIVYPSTPYDALGLLKSAIRDPNPVIFFEHKRLYRKIRQEIPDGEILVPLGSADIKRPGHDLTIITYGAMVHDAIEAAETLGQQGYECEVLDLRSLCPLDEQSIYQSIARTHRALVVHEAHLTGGFGGELAARIAAEAFDQLDAPITRVGAADVPIPYSPPLEDAVLPNADKIVAAALRTLEY
ncbi:alpha-ketoacid dehydrogenase subunit beta [Castellaniella caeni]